MMRDEVVDSRDGSPLDRPVNNDNDRLPALDGLRSVAVLLVIAFHAGLSALRGGFVGVDLFFVLSGFVIVRAMLAEFDRSGTIRLGDFWRRRIARLVPASVLCIVVSAALFTLTSSPPERLNVIADARASLLFVSNWWFLGQSTDYFRDAVDSSPFLHMWSLSVEEQVYVALPLAFAGACRFLRRAGAWIGAALVVAVAATGWNMSGQSRYSELRVYFGTDTRIYQVLWGAAVAVLIVRSPRIAAVLRRSIVRVPVLVAGWVALAVLSSIDGLDPNSRGLYATMAAVALIAPLSVRGDGWCVRLLSLAPIRGLGEMSYGVYLWHWPVIIVLERVVVLRAMSLFGAATLVSVVLAYTMRQLVELPVIRWARRPRRGVRSVLPFGVLAVPLLAAIVVVPIVLTPDVAPLSAATRPGFSIGIEQEAGALALPVPADLGLTGFAPFEKGDYCINTTEIDGDCLMVDGGPRRVLVIGDSHADDLLPALSIVAREQGFALYAVVTAGCPWQPSLAYIQFDTPSCEAAQQAVFSGLVDRVRPDLIVVSAHAHNYAGFELRERTAAADSANIGDAAFIAATTAAATSLTGQGGRLVIIEPRSNSPFNAQNCLAVAEIIDDCAFVAGDEAARIAELLRAAAAPVADAVTVSIDDLLCPRDPVCDPILRGTIVRYDSDHLYAGFVQLIREALWARIESVS